MGPLTDDPGAKPASPYDPPQADLTAPLVPLQLDANELRSLTDARHAIRLLGIVALTSLAAWLIEAWLVQAIIDPSTLAGPALILFGIRPVTIGVAGVLLIQCRPLGRILVVLGSTLRLLELAAGLLVVPVPARVWSAGVLVAVAYALWLGFIVYVLWNKHARDVFADREAIRLATAQTPAEVTPIIIILSLAVIGIGLSTFM